MPDVYQLAAEHRRALLAQEVAATQRMTQAYEVAERGILESLTRLQTQISEAQGAGLTVNRSWLRRQERYQALLDQARAEINRFATFSADQTTRDQFQAVQAATRDTIEQLDAAGISSLTWNRLPTEAITDLVGFMGDGSPLTDRFKAIAPERSDEIGKALITGISRGDSPRDIARRIGKVSQVAQTEALTIARTEVQRAYRESSRRGYAENPRVVRNWIWLANLSARCCAMCAAMHGKVFPLEEPMGTHPNCRCTLAPIFVSVGVTLPQTGDQWLSEQTEPVQDAVLGSTVAGEAYRAKQVRLADFVGSREDSRWGLTRYPKSFKQLMEDLPFSRSRGPVGKKREMTDDQRMKELQEKTKVAKQFLQDRLGLRSRWSGDVIFQESSSDNWASARKKWSCSIAYTREVTDSLEYLYSFVLHESLHAVSVGLEIDTFSDHRKFEEGVVSKLTMLLRQEFLVHAGEKTALNFADWDHDDIYDIYVQQLEKMRIRAKMKEEDFYISLIKIPLRDREQTVKKWILQAKPAKEPKS